MFRKSHQKRKSTWSVAESTPIVEVVPQTVEECDDGVDVTQRVVFVPLDVTSKEAELSLPDAKEYTLENLLKAGVPLSQLSVSGMLNPVDFASNAELASVVASKLSVDNKD